jgi:hypothetical protein
VDELVARVVLGVAVADEEVLGAGDDERMVEVDLALDLVEGERGALAGAVVVEPDQRQRVLAVAARVLVGICSSRCRRRTAPGRPACTA